MSATNYRQWVADGAPWHPAKPIADFVALMRGHGFLCYVLGAVGSHLNIPRPEDHAPFSHSPWPGAQPYPAVLACDVMPGGAVDWRALGEQIVADRNAGVHGTEWIKYINITDRAGNCWHDSWEPDHTRTPSSDTGHLHISARTDYATSDVVAASGWDPVARVLHASANPATTGGGRMIVMAHEKGSNVDWIGDGIFRYRCPDADHRKNALVVMRLQGNPNPESVEFNPGTLDALGPIVVSASSGTPTTAGPAGLSDADRPVIEAALRNVLHSA